MCEHLPSHVAAVVLFLFFCPWRVGAARRLEWRDYSEADQTLTLRRELNKSKHQMKIPVDPEHTPELMGVIERQQAKRRSTCPFIFHSRNCGAPRFDRDGNRRPCLGDFQKVWDHACAAIGMTGRIPHDLRRSGVKHYIDAGVDAYTVMRWSGHRTESMLRRYHIVDLDDLRRAGKKASDYQGRKQNVIKGDFGQTAPEPPQDIGNSRPAATPSLS
jgi:integrase